MKNKFIYLIIGMILLLSSISFSETWTDITYTNSSMLYYIPDNSTSTKVYDNATGKHPGNLSGTISINKDTTGKYFTCGGGYVAINNASDFNFGYNNFTISFWMNKTTGDTNGIFALGSTGSGIVDFLVFTNNQEINWFIGNAPLNAWDVGLTSNGNAINTWHFIVLTKIGSIYIMYVDGINSWNGSKTTSINTISSASLCAGANSGFIGNIENFVILNRTINNLEVLFLNSSGRGYLYNMSPYGTPVIYSLNITAQYPDGTNTTDLAYWNANNLTCSANVTGNATIPYIQWAKNANIINLNTGQVLWLRLNNETGENQTKVLDWSGNGNNGDVVNATYTPDGKINGAYSFDGNVSKGYINLGSPANLNFTNATKQDFTISVWFNKKGNNQMSTGTQLVSRYWTSGGGQRYYMLFIDTLDKVVFTVWANTSLSPSGSAIYSSTNISLNTWYHVVAVANSTNISLYINGVLNKTGANTLGTVYSGLGTANTYIGAVVSSTSTPDGSFNGSIDEVRIYNRSLSASEILELYNLDKNTYNDTLSVGDNITCQVTAYSGSNNATSSRNIIILNYPYNINSVTYSNYLDFYNNNYTRILNYILNYTCDTLNNTKIIRNINSISNKTYNLTCNRNNNIIQDNFTNSIEGTYNITFFLNNTLNINLNNYSVNKTFISDLYGPTAITNYIIYNGFVNSLVNISLNCTDTIMPNLTYNLSFNNIEYYYNYNTSKNKKIINQTNGITGNNILYGFCSDYFSNDTDTKNFILYTSTLFLIGELNNSYFDVRNISSAKSYVDDNSSYFDFKLTNASSVNFTSNYTNKLRFELIYSDGATITRYIDASLFNGTEIRVCANREGVTHFEQLVTSASIRAVKIKNIYSNCYIAADYTRFVYQDSYILKAFTIASSYILITGNEVILGNIDGSISSYISIDTLEFKKQAYTIVTEKDIVSIQKTNSSQLIILYTNIKNDNAYINMTIRNTVDNSILVNYDLFVNPNNFTYYFDYSLLTGINDSTIFSITFNIIRDDGSTATIKKYANTQGKTGILNSAVAFAISFLLMLFGLTLTSARMTFGWFGIIMIVLSIGITTFAVNAWYIIFLQVVEVLCLIYMILFLIKENNIKQV